jgi:hypothetical protein
MKGYSLWVYLFLLLFILFYILLLPLIIINIINSDQFISFKNEFINNSIKNVEPHYINTNTDTNGIVKINRNTITGHTVEIEDNVIRSSEIINNNYEIDTLNLYNQPQASTSQSNTSQFQHTLTQQLSNNTNLTIKNNINLIDVNSITNQVKLLMDKVLINSSYSFEIKRLIIFYKILYPNCNNNEIEIINNLNQDNKVITKSFYKEKTIEMILNIIINQLQNINNLTIKRINEGLTSLLNCNLINLEEKKLINSLLLRKITNNNLINIESITNFNNDLIKIDYKSLNRQIINLNID